MKKYCYILVMLLISCAAHGNEEPAVEAPKPLDPSYYGTHGMLLFSSGSILYASNQAKYRRPHNAQIIYKLESKSAALVYLVKDADLVTIIPEPFNLQRLMRGEEVTVKADVYVGHYERQGSLIYEQLEVTFADQKYVRMLENFKAPTGKQTYDLVELSSNARLLVHQIQGAPSYDHVILLMQDVMCSTDVYAQTSVPDENYLITRLSFCGSMKPIYYETQDFAEGISDAGSY
ncbi:hypothetical protein [Aliiglaciecola sp. LCG003]|uniref:hypothetical protein n=1 Tax=Aliiglaciecola sp. LCG003 TaxID=3053655 RepID=UPI002573C9E3|nr:hypothetical protein [Aliiglaciecola sp. LCG003]WJG08561.1 hypothetical protein QR722_14625 [Aliiglaciecola sp. LCG003]